MADKDNSKEDNITDEILEGNTTILKVEYPPKRQDLWFEQSDSVFELGGYVDYYFD